jgi:metallo-beta-lactamase class B
MSRASSTLIQVAIGVVVAVAVFAGGVLYPMWRRAVDTSRDARADPHHIAGNLYFVGDPAETSFLLVGDKGHALIGSAGQNAAHKIADNMRQLQFDIKDVRMVLAAGQFDSLAELKQASGAELWASDASAGVIASGGTNNPGVVFTPYRLLARAGITSFPPARVDHRVRDNETIRLGSLAITAHVASGAFDCTAWTFTVRDRDRDLRVVHRCGLQLPYKASLVDPERPPGIRAGFEQAIAMLRSLPVDIWLTSPGREYGRYRKYQESLAADDPAAPFIDPDGYRASIDQAEAAFLELLAEQQKGRRR